MTLPEIIERLEKATGADRQLDADIRTHAVGLEQYESIHERGGDLCLRYYADPTGPSYFRLPRYTASLDAALTLVREGWQWTMSNDPPSFSMCPRWSDDSAPAFNSFDVEPRKWGQPTRKRHYKGATPAIALCIAALRARLK